MKKEECNGCIYNKAECLLVLNKLEVIESSIECNEVIYVFIKDCEENRRALVDLGATKEDLSAMKTGMEGCYGDLLDITDFAFNKLGVEYWGKKCGFVYDIDSVCKCCGDVMESCDSKYWQCKSCGNIEPMEHISDDEVF